MSDNELEMDLLIRHATEDTKFIFFQGKNEEKLEICMVAAGKSTFIQQFLEEKQEDLMNNNDIVLILPNAEISDLKKIILILEDIAVNAEHAASLCIGMLSAVREFVKMDQLELVDFYLAAHFNKMLNCVKLADWAIGQLSETNYKAVSAVSSLDISNAFDALGLKDDDFKEINEDEESIFQKVLAKKMVCDICMARMKALLCPDCFNPICTKCFADLPEKTCPFCRKANNQFVPIKLPRL